MLVPLRELKCQSHILHTLSVTSMSRSLFLKTLTPPSTILCPGLLILMMGLTIPTMHTQPPHLLDKLHNPSVSMHMKWGTLVNHTLLQRQIFPVPTSVLKFSQTCDVAKE